MRKAEILTRFGWVGAIRVKGDTLLDQPATSTILVRPNLPIREEGVMIHHLARWTWAQGLSPEEAMRKVRTSSARAPLVVLLSSSSMRRC